MKRVSAAAAAAVLLAGVVTVLGMTGAVSRAELPSGGATAVKPPALADVEQKFEPGLALTFQSGNATDVRLARLVALQVPADRPPTPFLPAGPFKATWAGNLQSRIRDTVTFSAAGRGAVKVSVNDQVVLDASGDDLSGKPGKPVQLRKGKNKFVVEYAPPAGGAAAAAELRLMWQGESFAPEPVPPTAFTHDVSDKVLREHARLRDGRTLFGDLRCIKCHAPGEKFSDAAMPELSVDAPSLADVGSRLNEGYVAAWIENPKSLRPQAQMPRVLHGGEAAGQARDIAAYLATLGAKSSGTVNGDPTVGARTFTTLGCIACHTAPDAADKADPARLPLSVVRAKWQPAALVSYLKQPERTYAWTRMPNFRLSDAEAANLAAYLLTKSPEKAYQAGGDATRGQKLFATAGCLNCHTAPGTNDAKSPSLADLAKSDWTKGCLAKDDAARGRAPDFALTDDQRAALQSFAASDWNSLTRDNPIEVAERQFTLANCTACHTRDNLGDTWSDLREEIAQIESTLPPPPDTGEKYAPDQSRPPLTWVGEKLKYEWMAKFIGGHIPYKPRPYIQARMPGFPARAELLAAGFANEHGYAAAPSHDPAPDPALIPIGRRLVGKAGGFSCNNCHSIGDTPASAPFEAPAPNFAHVADRLRHDYYVRWVRNPQRVERGTRMPTFANSDGKTAVRDVLDGDADKQFNAIWNYLLQGPNVQPPQ